MMKNKNKKIIQFINKLSLLLFVLELIYASFYIYAYFTPKFQINVQDNIIYYDINNNVYDTNNDYVKIDNINENVINAIISAEDKNFYKHSGFDFLRIIKAIFINVKSGEIKQGASTISQQYIKNLYLTFDKTWQRKIEEAILTIELETHYSKNEILEGYLNAINYGNGCYGIKEASNYYFNKEPKELTIEEATVLVGIPKNPSYYNPIEYYNNNKERQKDILNLMYKNGYISYNDIDIVYNNKTDFYAKKDNETSNSIYYYKDAVIDELNSLNILSNSLLDIDNINIYTNLDLDTQKLLEKNIKNEMRNTTMQTSSIIIESQTGKIVSLIGGKDYSNSQYNRVLNSKRQVGSTIKPFLYYNALENGFTASTTFLSERTTFNLGTQTYSPKNANNIYANKNISMLSAIAYSDNIYAMKTHLFLGEEMLTKIIKKIKIKEEVKPLASSALGTTEINILDYANGYITLANEGNYIKPHLIEKITDKNNNILYEFKYEYEELLDKKIVFILNNLLSSTYDYNLVSYTSPTLISISGELNSKYAVKSGSTSTDFWTVGYNKNYLMMIWNGNDNNENVKASESKITKRIWAKTITNIKNNNGEWYDIPNDIISTKIDPISGEIKENGYLCYYINGTEPSFYNEFLAN